MSMRDYPVNSECAFLVTNEVMARVKYELDKKAGMLPEELACLSDEELTKLIESDDDRIVPTADEFMFDGSPIYGDVIEAIPCYRFDGNADTKFPERAKNPIAKEYNEGELIFIDAPEPALIGEGPFKSEEEILGYFKSIFDDAGIALPADFDWWAHIVEIDGVSFG